MYPVIHQGPLRSLAGLASELEHLQPQVGIFSRCVGPVIAACTLPKDLAKHTAGRDLVFPGLVLSNPRIRLEKDLVSRVAGIIYKVDRRVTDCIQITFKNGQMLFYKVRMQSIVRIQANNVFAAGRSYTNVPCFGHTKIFRIAYQLHRILLGNLA